jgi:APA family basic amino acid/polyamine antiporter
VLDWQQLDASSAPLADVIKKSLGENWGFGILVIALFATTNTVLIMLVSGSRILYGVSLDRALPSIFAAIHQKRKTPWVATIIIGALAASFVFIGDIGTVANISVFAIIMVFVLVNFSLIWLRYKQPDIERPFRAPVNAGKFPILAALGIVTPILGIIQLDLFVILLGLGVVICGALFWYAYNKIRK